MSKKPAKKKAVKKPAKKKNGRPTIFTKKLAESICFQISQGISMRKLCKPKTMPTPSTIFYWLLDDDKKEFLEQYKGACDMRADLMFEELLEIADSKDKNVIRARLRIDTRKWYLSKIMPKKYGEKLDVMSGGKPIKGNKIILTNFEDEKEDE